jgi:C4-dicarboxylate-specific signal transduction histidine kinase
VKNLRQLFNARDYELDEIDLQRVTNEILEIIEPTLKSKKIRLNKTFNANPLVLGDSIQIQQVLINLFNNATDAIECSNPELREIKLTISADKAFAVISIEDSGSGIEPSQLPHLFELYKTTKKDGLGVGLWLSKTIIDKHHGTISAANHMHGGAIFTLQIPLAHQSR